MSTTPQDKVLQIAISNLPLLDANVMEIIALLDASDTNFKDILKKLSPEVTTRFLRMANSSFYGQQVHDINHALRVLGFNAMKHSLVTSMMMGHFAKAIDPDFFNVDKFHNQGQFCAAVSSILARILDYDKQSEVFTASLMHNIGKLVIAAYFPDEHILINTMKEEKNLPASEAEKIVLGCSHAEISATVLEKFNIPRNLCQAVRYHDTADRKLDDENEFELEMILRESARIVDSLNLPDSLKPEDIIKQLHDRITEDRELILDIKKEAIMDHGFQEVFTDLLRRAGELLENHLKTILKQRTQA